MRAALLTREFPPEVYGGAGVHVEYLARELGRLLDLEVHCFGAPRPGASAYSPVQLGNPALDALEVDLRMAAAVTGADVVHSHTWYANLGGHLAKLLHGVPHVVTSHSLEPLRPWKAEQLGGGYAVSSWAERTAIEAADAVIAVSHGMRADVLAAYPAVDPARVHVVLNGIDTEEYRPVGSTGALDRLGVEPGYVLFIGRITRQKGVEHLLRALLDVDPAVTAVVCAGAADTPELAAEVAVLRDELVHRRGNVVWVEEMLARHEAIELLSHAAVFACPSVYEPLGIVNLEAMACATAVVASAVGGIPEVVVDGETGLLVPPADPSALAAAIGSLLADAPRRTAMGVAGRARAQASFSWSAIAEQTRAVYASVV